MQIKLLKDVVSGIAGKPASDIVDLLYGKRDINEFLIAKKLKLTINQIRNILYKLSDYGVVSSIRKKDKKKGWYTYFWKFEIPKALEFLKSEIEKKIMQIKNQVKSKETKQFYICEKCNIEFNEENALLHNFTCQECGEVLSLKDNTKSMKDLKRNLEKLEKEKEIIDQELIKEKEKGNKVKFKKLEKIEKEKVKKRIKDREKRRADKKMEEKKMKKKIRKITNAHKLKISSATKSGGKYNFFGKKVKKSKVIKKIKIVKKSNLKVVKKSSKKRK